MTALRRVELFALRWRDFDEQAGCLRVCEAVYEGTFDDPKTEAGVRLVPLPEAALQFIAAWRKCAKKTEQD